MSSEERGRYAIAGIQGSTPQSLGPDGQPKRQLFDFGATNDKRSRDCRRKKESGSKRGETTAAAAPRPFYQAPPVILERRDPQKPSTQAERIPTSRRFRTEEAHLSVKEEISHGSAVVKIMDTFEEFRIDAALRALADYPGHFVVGVVGKQGVGKSTILSSFAEHPENTFKSTPSEKPFDHQTTGIDMYVTAERIILLDTQPVLSWSVLEHTLRHGTTDGLPGDIWRDLKSLQSIMLLLAISDVVLVVSEGAEADFEMLRCLKRADMLKHGIPEFPLIPSEKLGLSRPEINVQPQIVFVNNKCQELEFCQQVYDRNTLLLKSMLSDSKLEWQGLISFSNALPRFKKYVNLPNLFLLPYTMQNKNNVEEDGLECFDDLVRHLRNQVFAATRKSGKRGQISERDWFRNAVKTYDLILKSELVSEYLKTLRRIKNG
ncbi:unnamed protein product [Umbelopsis vinacea]